MKHRWTWQRKVLAELAARGQTRMDLVRHLDAPQRTVYGWLDGTFSPRDKDHVLEQIAKWFGWPTAYLRDESIPYPPSVTEDDAERAFRALTPDAWEIVNALADPDAVAFLAGQLRQYRAMRKRLER